jgi:hypothetical protein
MCNVRGVLAVECHEVCLDGAVETMNRTATICTLSRIVERAAGSRDASRLCIAWLQRRTTTVEQRVQGISKRCACLASRPTAIESKLRASDVVACSTTQKRHHLANVLSSSESLRWLLGA